MDRTKSLSNIKIDGDEGHIEAVFSTFNVVDLDKDVTLPGAFENGAPVRISAYNHSSNRGAMLPVGKGHIEADDHQARVKGQFFMDTNHGRDTFLTLKALGELGEWSYGYDIIDSEKGRFEEQDVQFLKKLKVNEVSPVLLGAGIGTRTLIAKGLLDLDVETLVKELIRHDADEVAAALNDSSLKFADRLARISSELMAVNDRVAEERRTGKGASDDDREAVAQLESQFARLRDHFTHPSIKTELRKAQRSIARASMMLSDTHEEEE